jgi:hypothetical protein
MHDVREKMVVLAVNLEGMHDHGDWPIGHVIERESSTPLLPQLAEKLADPDVEVWVARDVWNPGGRGKIRTDDYLLCSLTAISPEKWRRALEEARVCQNADHSGRGSAEVTLKSGPRRVCEVSPHMHFATTVWGAALPSHLERPMLLQRARDRLTPLHGFLSQRVAGGHD